MITIDPVNLSDHHPQSSPIVIHAQFINGSGVSESILFVKWLSARMTEIFSTPDSIIETCSIGSKQKWFQTLTTYIRHSFVICGVMYGISSTESIVQDRLAVWRLAHPLYGSTWIWIINGINHIIAIMRYIQTVTIPTSIGPIPIILKVNVKGPEMP